MNGKAHTIRQTLKTLAVVASVAAVAVPAAVAGNSDGPGLVPSKLGSPDPRESQGKVFSPGMIASKLGSQDPRDTAAETLSQASIVASRLGSQDPRDTAAAEIAESSIVARQLGSPDTRDAALQSYDGDFMFRDYFGGTHWASQPQSTSNLNDLYRRNVALNDLHHGGQTAQVGGVSQVSTEDGFDWGNVEIGIVVAACGLLLLVALGIGARQVRQTRHGLGSA
jgi:hypothetical protein